MTTVKRELLFYLTLASAIALFVSYEYLFSNEDSGGYTEVIHDVNFEKLNIDIDCNIYVALGEEQKVVLEGAEQYLELIETELKEGIFTISLKTPGLLQKLKVPDVDGHLPLNIYVKLTDAGQLANPVKGTVITNESLIIDDQEKKDSYLSNFNPGLRNFLRLFSGQLGIIILQ